MMKNKEVLEPFFALIQRSEVTWQSICGKSAFFKRKGTFRGAGSKKKTPENYSKLKFGQSKTSFPFF